MQRDCCWNFCHPVNIYVYKNGSRTPPKLVHITAAARRTMKSVLEAVQDRVKLEVGYGQALYYLNGLRVCTTTELQMYEEYVVVTSVDTGFRCVEYKRPTSPLLVPARDSKHIRSICVNDLSFNMFNINRRKKEDKKSKYAFMYRYEQDGLGPSDLPMMKPYSDNCAKSKECGPLCKNIERCMYEDCQPPTLPCFHLHHSAPAPIEQPPPTAVSQYPEYCNPDVDGFYSEYQQQCETLPGPENTQDMCLSTTDLHHVGGNNQQRSGDNQHLLAFINRYRDIGGQLCKMFNDRLNDDNHGGLRHHGHVPEGNDDNCSWYKEQFCELYRDDMKEMESNKKECLTNHSAKRSSRNSGSKRKSSKSSELDKTNDPRASADPRVSVLNEAMTNNPAQDPPVDSEARISNQLPGLIPTSIEATPPTGIPSQTGTIQPIETTSYPGMTQPTETAPQTTTNSYTGLTQPTPTGSTPQTEINPYTGVTQSIEAVPPTGMTQPIQTNSYPGAQPTGTNPYLSMTQTPGVPQPIESAPPTGANPYNNPTQPPGPPNPYPNNTQNYHAMIQHDKTMSEIVYPAKDVLKKFSRYSFEKLKKKLQSNSQSKIPSRRTSVSKRSSGNNNTCHSDAENAWSYPHPSPTRTILVHDQDSCIPTLLMGTGPLSSSPYDKDNANTTPTRYRSRKKLNSLPRARGPQPLPEFGRFYNNLDYTCSTPPEQSRKRSSQLSSVGEKITSEATLVPHPGIRPGLPEQANEQANELSEDDDCQILHHRRIPSRPSEEIREPERTPSPGARLLIPTYDTNGNFLHYVFR